MRKCFARAVDREHLRGGVQVELIAALNPLGESGAQADVPCGGRVAGQSLQVAAKRIFDELGCGMAGFAHAQADRGIVGRGRHLGKQLLQPLKG